MFKKYRELHIYGIFYFPLHQRPTLHSQIVYHKYIRRSIKNKRTTKFLFCRSKTEYFIYKALGTLKCLFLMSIFRKGAYQLWQQYSEFRKQKILQ